MRKLERCVKAAAIIAALVAGHSVAIAKAPQGGTERGGISGRDGVPLRQWGDRTDAPVAIVVAIHGMTLHGGTYDHLARELAKQGVYTFAPDMRGFGRCHSTEQSTRSVCQVNYQKSKEDLLSILRRIKAAHPGTPIFCLGESLGANLGIWLSSSHADLVDGVILSSPCIKRYWHLSPWMVYDISRGVTWPWEQLSLKPYVGQFLSKNPEVVRGYENDPLIRKTMTIPDLLKSLATNRSALKAVKNIPATMPVLVVAGTEDRMYKPQALAALVAQMPSSDEHIYWAKKRGHLLLETTEVDEDILQAVSDWIKQHAREVRELKAQSSVVVH